MHSKNPIFPYSLTHVCCSPNSSLPGSRLFPELSVQAFLPPTSAPNPASLCKLLFSQAVSSLAFPGRCSQASLWPLQPPHSHSQPPEVSSPPCQQGRKE